MNDRLNRAVERLLLDKRFLRRFRRDPEAALTPFALTAEEIEAVKEGDASRLIGLGLDPRYVWPKVRSPLLPMWVLARAKKLTPALVLAALALPASPALARRRRSERASPVGRVSRYFARQGIAGAFYARLARTGRAGELASRAATRRDTSAYFARARRAAREEGIKPPPGGETP
jgi:Aromatic-ring-opening dioxygenase LigAB, LigA subunit